MEIDLKGHVAIVTGAGRGIGLCIARRLAEEGARVVIAEADEARLAATAETWRREGWEGLQLRCDVRQAADCQAVVETAERSFGRVDILVNNAGVAAGGPVETMDEAVWDRVIDVNLKGTFLMCQAVIPAMRRRGRGRILCASSFAAVIPSVGGAAYAASKSGVESLVRVLASELGPHGITANAYVPGMIPTEMNRFADQPDSRKSLLLDTLSLRRWGTPDDIARLVCFLASDQADYITGAMVDISGGKFATQMPWMAWRTPG